MIYNEQRKKKEEKKKKGIEEITGIRIDNWISELPVRERQLAKKLTNAIIKSESISTEKSSELMNYIRDSFELESFKDFAAQLDSVDNIESGQLIQLFKDWKVIEAGKLSIIHGHEFGGSFFNPVNAARGLFMRAKSSVLAGHNHQTSEHQEGNIKGDSIACWSTGCLCELSPEYRPMAFTKWNLGAAIVDHNEDGQFFVDNFRIIKGSEGYRIA